MFKDTPLLTALLMRLLSEICLCPKWRSQLQHFSSTRKCPAEGDRAGRSPGPCSLVPEHLLHWWPQFYTSRFRHCAKQLFKQKPAVSHLDDRGEKFGQHTETLPRDYPSPITFTHFQLQKETVQEQKLGGGKWEIKMWQLNTLVFHNMSNYPIENEHGYCSRTILPQRCHWINIGQISWLNSNLESLRQFMDIKEAIIMLNCKCQLGRILAFQKCG